jgi:hypothetical protein
VALFIVRRIELFGCDRPTERLPQPHARAFPVFVDKDHASLFKTSRRAAASDMTDEQCAAFDFEPWAHRPDDWQPPTNEQWHKMALTYLPTVRITWLMLFKTKAELMEMIEQIGKVDELTGAIADFW